MDRLDPIRILLLADSHLGFDHPARPRVKRRRRGHDFLANYRRALRFAIDERVDLVVHGGDVFHTPTAPASLVYEAFDPLKEVAETGIPVFVVPGNHERSRIPFDWLAKHSGVHVFQEPGTTSVTVGGARVAIAGLPCVRRSVRGRFKRELVATAWDRHEADVRLLVTHQAFEGAVVGVQNFVFRGADDVVRLRDVPAEFAAVLSGHIHRSQILERDLAGRLAPAPVFYPGSLERTAFAERLETKGFLTLDVAPEGAGGVVRDWTFHDIEARPMEVRSLVVADLGAAALERSLRETLADVAPDTVLRLEADGPPTDEARFLLRAESLRAAAPDMNIDLVIPGQRRWSGGPRSGRRDRSRDRVRDPLPPSSSNDAQGTLF